MRSIELMSVSRCFFFLCNSHKCIIWFQFLTCIICKGNLLRHWLLIYLVWIALASYPRCIQLRSASSPNVFQVGAGTVRGAACLPVHVIFSLKPNSPWSVIWPSTLTTLTSSVRHTLVMAAGSNSQRSPSVRKPVHIWVLTACLYRPCAQQSGTVMLRGRENRKLHLKAWAWVFVRVVIPLPPVMDGDVTSKLSLEKGIILPLGCY